MRASPSASLRLVFAGLGCSSFVEVPVETPLQSKLDVTAFPPHPDRRLRDRPRGLRRRPLGRDLAPAAEPAALEHPAAGARARPARRCRTPSRTSLAKHRRGGQLRQARRRSSTASRPTASSRTRSSGGRWARSTSSPSSSPASSASRARTAPGFQPDERVVRRPRRHARAWSAATATWRRKGFTLSADFYFIDSKTGELLHKERFTEEVLYAEDQRVSPLSSYFELMDRLLPNFLGVITPAEDPRDARAPALGDPMLPATSAGPSPAVLCSRLALAVPGDGLGPVHPVLRQEQGQVRQLRLADLQEPALRGLLLPGVRAAPRPADLLPRERLPEDLDRPQARDAQADPGDLLQDPLRVRADEPLPGLHPRGGGGLHRAAPATGWCIPIDEPPDQLQGLITHEMVHAFAFDLIPRGIGFGISQQPDPPVGGRGPRRLLPRASGSRST